MALASGVAAASHTTATCPHSPAHTPFLPGGRPDLQWVARWLFITAGLGFVALQGLSHAGVLTVNCHQVTGMVAGVADVSGDGWVAARAWVCCALVVRA